MNEFAIHIEYLLLSHNCVIVPSLGAFTAEKSAARWIADEELFLPPVRKVTFNPTIVEDPDGVFIHSLSEVNSISYEEATTLCDKFVKTFHKILVTEGSIDFGSIGLFTIEEDAIIKMSSFECGVVSPCYYGLDAIHVGLVDGTTKPVAEETSINPETIEPTAESPILNKVEETVADNQTADEVEENDTHITIRIRRSLIRTVISVAAILLLFFILRPSNLISNTQSRQAAVNLFLHPDMIVNKDVEKDTMQIKDEEQTDSFDAVLVDVTDDARNEGYDFSGDKKEESTQTTASVPEKVEAKQIDEQKSEEVKENYCIILASEVTKTNAEIFIASLQKKDVKATLYKDTNMLRVIIGGFSTYEAAHAQLSTLQQRGLASDGWVLKL